MPDMMVKLYDLPPLQPVLTRCERDGVAVRRAMAYEKAQVLAWVEAHFAGWVSECDVSFARQPISCFIATESGGIVGFACHDAVCRNFFGPTGVAEARRGNGIGGALLLSCLHSMAALGYAYGIIGGAGPTGFYEKLVGAVEIAGSNPGIYRDRLSD